MSAQALDLGKALSDFLLGKTKTLKRGSLEARYAAPAPPPAALGPRGPWIDNRGKRTPVEVRRSGARAWQRFESIAAAERALGLTNDLSNFLLGKTKALRGGAFEARYASPAPVPPPAPDAADVARGRGGRRPVEARHLGAEAWLRFASMAAALGRRGKSRRTLPTAPPRRASRGG